MKNKRLLVLVFVHALMVAFHSSVPKNPSQLDDSSRPVVTEIMTVSEAKPVLPYLADKEAEVTIGQIFQDNLDWGIASVLIGLRSVFGYFFKRTGRDLEDVFDSDSGLWAVIGLFFFIPFLFLFLRIIVFLMMEL
jgi:hypothetical protein